MPASAQRLEVDAVNGRQELGLRVESISKSYPWPGDPSGSRRLEVLDNISLHVPPGELVSIIGPSGCGKTTLLRLIDGLTEPDSGRILLDDRPVQDNSALGIVFQDIRLLPWRTVTENVGFALELKSHKKLTREDREKVSYYVEAVGLSRFADAYPYKLSGGMQQRVGFARALAREPAVVLLDECFGSLDAQTRLVMQDFFLSLLDRFKLTALLVTHDIDEAVYMASQCVVLSRPPARVKAVIDIDLPTPRHLHDVRANPELVRYRSELWSLLRTDVLETAGG